jgi:hypothetical protein
MRIAERITRLEQRGNADPRMTAAEIDTAAGLYEKRLAEDQCDGATHQEARSGWRSLVDAPGSGWQQRVYAAMDPQDAYL